MSDFRVVEFEDEQPQHKAWLLEETEAKCDYCRALNHVLLISHFDREMLPHLTGLLHDITHSMADDMVVPRSQSTVVHLIP